MSSQECEHGTHECVRYDSVCLGRGDLRGALAPLPGVRGIAHVIFHFGEDRECLSELWSALALQRANRLRQELARNADASRLHIKSRQAHLRIRRFLAIASHLAFLELKHPFVFSNGAFDITRLFQ